MYLIYQPLFILHVPDIQQQRKPLMELFMDVTGIDDIVMIKNILSCCNIFWFSLTCDTRKQSKVVHFLLKLGKISDYFVTIETCYHDNWSWCMQLVIPKLHRPYNNTAVPQTLDSVTLLQWLQVQVDVLTIQFLW